MPGFSDLAVDVDAAVRERLTDPALWRAGGTGDGVEAGVILEQPDVEIAFGQSRAVAASAVLGVFRVDVAAPAKGDTAQLVDTGRLFRVIARPQLDADGTYWRCEAAEVTS